MTTQAQGGTEPQGGTEGTTAPEGTTAHQKGTGPPRPREARRPTQVQRATEPQGAPPGGSAGDGRARRTQTGFVVPVWHVRIPEAAVTVAFWGALAGAAAIGAVDPPIAALIGAGVIVARHGRTAATR